MNPFFRIRLRSNLSIAAIMAIAISLTYCKPAETSSETVVEGKEVKETSDSLRYEDEKHFKNIRQLTFGADNAEAYWSFDNTKLTFQSNNPAWGVECDQMFLMDLSQPMNGQKPPMISTGLGRTTCSYFLPGDSLIVYSSTHLGGDPCPAEPEHIPGTYLWPVYDTYDIFVANLKGEVVAQLTDAPGYDAEPTVSPNGDKIVFTSTRSGDLELWTMNIDGSDKTQVTTGLGYDGGAFFSPDGKKLIFRASRPSGDEVDQYKEFLSKGLVAPTAMELYVCNVDGSDLKQITSLGKANWAPYFHPSGEKIIFSSNHHAERGFKFNLFMIDADGENLEQISHDGVFDSFPMFSYDGKQIVFSSNRNNGGTYDTNLFIADWVD